MICSKALRQDLFFFFFFLGGGGSREGALSATATRNTVEFSQKHTFHVYRTSSRVNIFILATVRNRI